MTDNKDLYEDVRDGDAEVTPDEADACVNGEPCGEETDAPCVGARSAESLSEQSAQSLQEQSDGDKQDYTPKNKTERAMLYVYRNEQLTYSLRIASSAIVILTVYALLYDLVVALSQSDFYHIATVLVSTGVPFLLVTFFRKLINAPRPYEILPFYETSPKAKRGQSFPSRHVFSVFVIGSVLCFSNPFVGILLLAAGVALSLVRVLLGYHFVRDVVAGALIGVTSGVIGTLIFNLLG